MFALLALLGSPVAIAQAAYDAHGFNLAPSDGDPLDPLAMWRPEVQVKRSFGAVALLERIHEVGLRTVDLCALDAYVDTWRALIDARDRRSRPTPGRTASSCARRW